MNQEAIDRIRAKIATALGLMDEVGRDLHGDTGLDVTDFKRSRRALDQVRRELLNLEAQLTHDWAEDEKDLDETIATFKKDYEERSGG